MLPALPANSSTACERRHRAPCAADALLEVPAAYGGRGAFLCAGHRPMVEAFLARCREDLALLAPGAAPVDLAASLADLPCELVGRERVVAGLFDGEGELAAVLDVRAAPGGRAWTIAAVMVRPDLRGRGIAAALLEALEGWVKSEGGEAIRFPVDRRNRPAVCLARRAGFAPRGSSPRAPHVEDLVRQVA
ncbi:MAG TPA: GNAT family N-acetyltransferase [Anaeromyxobacteraceae bacterium]|nr:GNAT family N-acetyltransferase [Anaeromyxobacteraceae bacterium]